MTTIDFKTPGLRVPATQIWPLLNLMEYDCPSWRPIRAATSGGGLGPSEQTNASGETVAETNLSCSSLIDIKRLS